MTGFSLELVRRWNSHAALLAALEGGLHDLQEIKNAVEGLDGDMGEVRRLIALIDGRMGSFGAALAAAKGQP